MINNSRRRYFLIKLVNLCILIALFLISSKGFSEDFLERPEVWGESSRRATQDIIRELAPFGPHTRDNIRGVLADLWEDNSLSYQEHQFWEAFEKEFINHRGRSEAEIKEFVESLNGSASVTGDPHLMTGDGYTYDFQAVGEFIFVSSDDENLIIQGRLQPFTDSISVATAFAMKVGKDIVSLYVKPNQRLVVNHKVVEIEKNLKLSDGGFIYKNDSEYQIVWPDKRMALIKLNKSHINFRISNKKYSNIKLSGLLGNFNGKLSDDIFIKNGETINFQNTSYADLQKDLYGRFGNSWRIMQEESLFDYLNGESTKFFTNLNFPRSYTPLASIKLEKIVEARKICIAKGVKLLTMLENCTLDIALTGDESFAESASFITKAWPKHPSSEHSGNDDSNSSMTDPCQSSKDCATCNARGGCGFCASNGKCLSDSNITACELWLGTISSCRSCNYTTCTTCTKDAYCLWSNKHGCLNSDAKIRNSTPEESKCL